MDVMLTYIGLPKTAHAEDGLAAIAPDAAPSRAAEHAERRRLVHGPPDDDHADAPTVELARATH